MTGSYSDCRQHDDTYAESVRSTFVFVLHTVARPPRRVPGWPGGRLTDSRGTVTATNVNAEEFHTVVADGPGFILITVSGPYSWARVDRLLRRILIESESRGSCPVLVDATAVPVNLTTTDKYTMGVDAALRLGGRVKVALLGAPVTIDGFGETVARNRGGNVGVFTDQAAAVRWLVGTAPESLRS